MELKDPSSGMVDALVLSGSSLLSILGLGPGGSFGAGGGDGVVESSLDPRLTCFDLAITSVIFFWVFLEPLPERRPFIVS